MIDKMNAHYSLTNPASVYDEEALTALELVGRTTAKVNECVEAINNVDAETDQKLKEFEKEFIPATVKKEVSKQIQDGTFDEQIAENLDNLNERVNNLLTNVPVGSTTMDAEVIDSRVDASGTVHPNAGEATREQVRDLRKAVSKPNLIDRKKLVKGYIDTHDNEFPQTTNYEYHTEYIPVEAGKEYFYHIKHHTGYVTPWARVCYYDVVKNKIGDKSLGTSDRITIPADTKYIRLSFRSGMFCDVKLEEGNYATSIVEPKTAENLLEDYPLCLEGFLTTAGHIGDQTEAGHVPGEPQLLEMCSEFIPVNAGDEFTVYNESEKCAWFSVAFHDKDGMFLDRPSFEQGQDKSFTFTVPSEAVAMRLCARTLYLNKLIVSKSGTNMADYCNLLADRFKPTAVRGYSSTTKGIAHRGLSSVAPENTLSSIRAAAKAGFKYVEFDARMTGDGTAVLLHDETLDRTTNKTGDITGWGYEELTGEAFGDEPVDAGSWFSSEFAGEKLPTLVEALNLCQELNLHAYVEIKAGSDEVYMSIVQPYKDNITILHNNPWNVCLWAEAGYRVGYVCSDMPTSCNDSIDQNMGDFDQTNMGEIFLDLAVDYAMGYPEEFEYIPRKIETWTVDDEATIKNLDRGITGVTSNTVDASQLRYKYALEGE